MRISIRDAATFVFLVLTITGVLPVAIAWALIGLLGW